jgi:hypothetical protein
MISVFSSYVKLLKEAKLVNLTEDCSISELYDGMRIAYNQGATVILNDVRIICPCIECEEDEDDYYEILYESWSNEDLKAIVQWINKKIVLEIGNVDYRTIGVRLRIADNMLLKLVDSDAMTKKIYDKIHYFLCNNVWNEIRLVVNDGLPF